MWMGLIWLRIGIQDGIGGETVYLKILCALGIPCLLRDYGLLVNMIVRVITEHNR
jgi:hypothetical protein